MARRIAAALALIVTTLPVLALAAPALVVEPLTTVPTGTYRVTGPPNPLRGPEPLLIRFGSVIQGEKVEAAFTVRNAGDTHLLITGVQASCGCTAAVASAQQIEPGASGVIRITFDSHGFAGPVVKTVTETTNDPQNSVATVQLEGTVIEEIVVEPKFLNFGQFKPEVPQRLEVTVTNRGQTPLHLLTARSSGPEITVAIGQTVIAPGASGKFQVAVTAGKESRYLSGFVAIATDAPRKPEITISLLGSVVP